MDPHWRRWLDAFHPSPQTEFLQHALPYAPMEVRKALLLYSRVQQSLRGTRLSSSLGSVHTNTFFVPPRREGGIPSHLTIHSLMDSVDHSPSDPVFMGFLAMVVRNAPWADYTEIKEVREKTIQKEMDAALGVHHPVEFDYSPILSHDPEDRHRRIAPNLPVSVGTHENIYRCFRMSAELLSGHTFYPRSSKKSIGRFAQKLIKEALEKRELEIFQEYAVSLDDVERLYHETGWEAEGPIEMRVAFKYLDLKPRVYFAQGPTVYGKSKFVQEIFNIILDCFPPVHRYNRFELPIENILSAIVRLAIYDYKSFTSKLHEIRAFLRALALFYKETYAVFVDTRVGPVTRSVGEYLLEYTETCNEQSFFDICRVADSEPGLIILLHNCGALGVPGNISSCTLLHGIMTCVSRQSLYSTRVVGDDALTQVRMYWDQYGWEEFLDQMSNIGDISEEKADWWDFDEETEDPDRDGWHYTKRPIARFGHRILRGDLYTWPSIANILGLSDDVHTEVPESLYHRRKKFLVQWKRLLDNLHSSAVHIPDSSRELLLRFQDAAYKALDLPWLRFGPVVLPDGQRFVLPKRYRLEDFGRSWVDVLVENAGEGIWGTHRLPRFAGVNDLWTGRESEIFVSSSTRLLSLMVRLGYMEKQLELEDVELTPYMPKWMLTLYLEMDYTFCYRYEVYRDVPGWVSELH
ncbi:hypothetical protein [Phlebiopsis gigantea ambi-like virus 2]|nr:hypothetical protein [Phlebiopsis gigantea ambi-like virus 2]